MYSCIQRIFSFLFNANYQRSRLLILILMFLPIIKSLYSIPNRISSFHSKLKLSRFMTMSSSFQAIHVKGKLIEHSYEKFYLQTLNNAKNSIIEEGISRFDVCRNLENPSEFLLIEVYNSDQGPIEHKQTLHYNNWRDIVAPFMEQPRSAKKYNTIFPSTEFWKTMKSANNIEEANYMQTTPWISSMNHHDHTSIRYNKNTLLVVVVDINVIDGMQENFINASLRNCQNSIREGGIHRFDLLQNAENKCNFILVEVYNHPDAPAAHKQTDHYKNWASEVASMMATPRSASRFESLFPSSLYWHYSANIIHQLDHQLHPVNKGLSGLSGFGFNFLSPKISVGRNIVENALKSSISSLNLKKPFIITGQSGLKRYEGMLKNVLGQSIGKDTIFCVSNEPTVENAVEATNLAKSSGCDGVIAIGGGSSIDLGKVVAALMTNHEDIFEYIEVIGKGKSITNRPVPFIAVPTTAGTGSEATKNAVLKSNKFQQKASIRHDWMIAHTAIIDPTLTISCPKDVTAHVGLDTLCQVIEPFVCNAPNPIVDALAREGIIRASRSLRNVVADGTDIEAREDMAIASLFGGLCLANAKLGTVHGYAAVLGGMYETAPHGAICALLLPKVFQKNAEKLLEIAKTGESDAIIKLGRFIEVSRMITRNPNASIEEGTKWLQALVNDLQVPNLSTLCGAVKEDIEVIATKAALASSTKGNPITWTHEEFKDVLHQVF